MTLRLWIPIAAFVIQGACATTSTAPVVAVPSLGAEDSSGAIRAARVFLLFENLNQNWRK